MGDDVDRVIVDGTTIVQNGNVQTLDVPARRAPSQRRQQTGLGAIKPIISTTQILSGQTKSRSFHHRVDDVDLRAIIRAVRQVWPSGKLFPWRCIDRMRRRCASWRISIDR
jgi:hypothetical protein